MIGMMPLYIVLRAVGMIRGDAVDQPAVARNSSSLRHGCARVVRVFSIRYLKFIESPVIPSYRQQSGVNSYYDPVPGIKVIADRNSDGGDSVVCQMM